MSAATLHDRDLAQVTVMALMALWFRQLRETENMAGHLDHEVKGCPDRRSLSVR